MCYFIQYLFVLCVCCPSLVWLCNGQLLSLTKLRSLFFFRSTSPEFRPGPYLLRYPNLYGGGEHYRCKVRGFIFSLCPLRIPSDISSVLKTLYVGNSTLHSCWTPSICLFHACVQWFKHFESSVSTETSITTVWESLLWGWGAILCWLRSNHVWRCIQVHFLNQPVMEILAFHII